MDKTHPNSDFFPFQQGLTQGGSFPGFVVPYTPNITPCLSQCQKLGLNINIMTRDGHVRHSGHPTTLPPPPLLISNCWCIAQLPGMALAASFCRGAARIIAIDARSILVAAYFREHG